MTDKKPIDKMIELSEELGLYKEQIIIDGVDVSKCPGFEGGCCVCVSLNANELDCEYNPDCYFKQLVRKTQECEELKAESFTREELITIQEKDIDYYRKALEEIEEIVKDWYKNEWSCYKCRINMDKKLKNILGIINKAKGDN